MIVKQGQEARDSLKKGVDLVADCVKVTIGPGGRNAVLGRRNILPYITNDGVSIARHIELKDPCENQGAWLVKEAAQLTSNDAGDGTTTTVVIFQKILEDGFQQLKDDGGLSRERKDTINLKKEIDEECEKIVQRLRAKARQITNDDIYNVAYVAGEYDWIAETVSKIFKEIGPDGFITIEEGLKNDYSIFNGIQIDAGYQSEYFINNDKRECELEKPYVLVTNQALDSAAIEPLVKILAEKQATQLVIIAPDFSKDLLNRFVTAKVKSTEEAPVNFVALQLPTFDKDDLMVDLALFSKAKFLDRKTYLTYQDLIADITFENLGTFDKAIISEGRSTLMGGKGDVNGRIDDLKKLISETESQFDKEKLEKRIAQLKGGFATIRVAGESETERTYFKLKMINAVNAAQTALKEGVVSGGGLALYEISNESAELTPLTNAIRAPYLQIQKNAGGVLKIEDSVIDSVRTITSALKSACYLAGLVLTTEVLVAYDDENKENNHD